MSYLSEQREWLQDMKRGDKIILERKAKDNENGWQNSWTRPMTRYVGQEVTLDNPMDSGSGGIHIMETWEGFPFFVFKKQSEMKSLNHIIASMADSIIKLA